MLRPSRQDIPLLVALLAIAFALFLNFALSSPESPKQPENERHQSETYRGGPFYQPNSETFWVRTVDDPIALYTAVLAVFTVVLAAASIWQGWMTKRSIDLARAEFLATHRPRVRVRWVSESSAERGLIRIRIAVVNVGESTAQISEVAIWASFVDGKGCFVSSIALGTETETLPVILKTGDHFVFERTSEKPVPEREWERQHEYGYFLLLDGGFTYSDETGLVRNTGFCRGLGSEEEGSFQVFSPLAHQEYED